MTNFREKLVDRMIALYGVEHELTVNFATLSDKTCNFL